MASRLPPVRRTNTALVYVFGALGGLLFGYDTGVISGALLFMRDDLALTPLTEGLVVSSMLVGAMIGALCGGPLSDRLGRRRIGLATAAIFAIGSVGAALAGGVPTMVLWRFVLGVGVGAASVVVPMYLAETAPTRTRGRVSTLNALMITAGILLAYIVNTLLGPSGSWRLMIGLAVVPAVLMLVGFLRMPESPRWLLRHGRPDDARAVLSSLRGGDQQEVEAELADIARGHRLESTAPRWSELFRGRTAAITATGVGLAALSQLVGINTIIYYAPTTLTNVGFEDVAALTGTIGIGSVNVMMTVVALLVIDRIGRRRLLLWGGIGMCASLAVLSLASLLLPDPDGFGAVALITLVSLAVFVMCFAISWGAVVWVVISEIFPNDLRGPGVGLSTLALWLANFAVSLAFPVLLTKVGVGWLFAGFAAVCLVAVVFVAIRLGETSGRSLEQIEREVQESS